MTRMLPPWCLCLHDHQDDVAVGAADAQAVGEDHDTFDVDVCQPDRICCLQGLVQVSGQLRDAGAIQEPMDDQHGLPEAAQRMPGSRAPESAERAALEVHDRD